MSTIAEQNQSRKEPSLLTFPAGTTDQEKADICRSELRPLLEQVAAIANRMMKDGMQLAFRIGPDQYGRVILHGIDITKPL